MTTTKPMSRRRNPAHGGYNHGATVAHWRALVPHLPEPLQPVVTDNLPRADADDDGYPRACVLWFPDAMSEAIMAASKLAARDHAATPDRG